MRFFFWLAFVVLVGIAIFSIQNSTAPSVDVRFLFWNFRTSLVYTILGSLACGMILVFFLWIPSAFKNYSQKKGLSKEIKIIGEERRHDAEAFRQRGGGIEKES